MIMGFNITGRTINLVISLFILVICANGCSSNKTDGWLPIKERSDGMVFIEGELAESNPAPCPDIILKSGNVKVIESTSINNMFQMGYKLVIEPVKNKRDNDISKYSSYTYQIKYRFVVMDKDGFPLQTIDGPNEFEIIELSKAHTSQNICLASITPEIKKRISYASVDFILSATKPQLK